MAGDQVYWSGIAGTTIPFTEARACNCMGPRPGDPVCPCMMPAHREREAGTLALKRLTEMAMHGKPRYRIKAGRREVPA